MRSVQVLALWSSVVVFAGCSSGAAGSAGPAPAFDVSPVDPGSDCPSGGQRVELGVDRNGNGTLDSDEITKTYLSCNGVSSTDGGAPLVVTVQEPAGKNCTNGGVAVESGLDANGDGKLSAKEITQTNYVCAGENGADGATGADGAPGADGKDGQPANASLISTSAEPAGAHCATGGALISGGTDKNDNGTLDPAEVTSTAYVCNGGTSLIRSAFESPGLNCLHGGFRVDSGLDTNLSGTLDDSEVLTTNYICNGANGLNGGADGLSSLVRTVAEPAGAHCPAGGVRIDMGIDDNQNTVLDPSEVDSSSYVCTGVNGVNGALTLVNTSAETAGSHCAAGGVKLDSGVDQNGDATLEPSEITATNYVCNGSAGQNGSSGLSSLVKTVIELPGSNCSAGGFKISTGGDLNGNGVLDANETTGTNYLCNGLAGLNGLSGLTNLVKTGVELPGVNCSAGGLKVSTGADANGNNVLDSGEITNTSYVCNGLNGLAGIAGTSGLSSLTKTALEPAGVNCAAGGFKVSTGSDTNGNGVLDSSEVTATNYLCNGLNGLAGATGLTGLVSLVKSTVELPGVNCALGGLKLGSGVDTNGNGVLDASEVTSNSYVCNGATGSIGATGLTGAAGASSLVKTSIELPGSHCTLGGLKVDSGVDTNKNLVLDSGEITSTNYLCTLS